MYIFNFRKLARSPEPSTVEPELEAVEEVQTEEVLVEIPVQTEEDASPAIEEESALPAEEEFAPPDDEQEQQEAPAAQEEQTYAPADSSPLLSPVRRARIQSPSPPPRSSTRESAARDYASYDKVNLTIVVFLLYFSNVNYLGFSP